MAAIWPGHWGYTPTLYEKCHVFFNTLENIYDERGLRTFRDLQSCYNLPGFSCFFYLQLRSSLKAYGVPWDRTLTSHPIAHWFETLKVKTIKVSLMAVSSWRNMEILVLLVSGTESLECKITVLIGN